MNRWTSLVLAVGGLTAFPLVDSAIKGTLILLLAAAVCLLLRKDSAATRHFVWTIAVCLLVAMPLLSLVLPQWRILPLWIYSEHGTSQQMSRPTVSNQRTFVDAAATNLSAFPSRLADFPVDMDDDESDVSKSASPIANMGSSHVAQTIDSGMQAATQISEWISLGWLIGCGVLLARLSIAAVMLRTSERRCVRLNGERQGVNPQRRIPTDGELPQSDESGQNPQPALFGSRSEDMFEPRRADSVPLSVEQDDAQRLMVAIERSKRAMGLKQRVTMLVDPNRSIPIVWGLWRTRLQLPKEAHHWNDEQLQSVLLHELAHVRRRDLFVLTMTQVACALHWFNPLVWIVAWRMHLERERACDDLVLNTGIRASSYAEHLLNVATRLTSSRWTQACGLAMARNSALHGRLSAVLNEKQNRRSVTTAVAFGFVLTATALAAPMAMLRGSEETKQEASKTGAGVFSQISDEPIPFPEAFNGLAWGEFHESGLRAAVVIDLEGNSVPLGTVVRRKLVLHNRGNQPLTIRLASIHHQQLGRAGIFRPLITDYKPTRLRYGTEVPPNSCIGLEASGIGFGDELTETQQLQIPGLQRVSAVAGDSFETSAEVRLLIGNQPDNVLALEQVSLKAGFLKLSVLPWKPDAPRKVRTADTIGNYIVADGLRLYVDLDSNEEDRFTARLVYSKSKPWESEPIWESDRITVTSPFQFVWTRHSGTVWLAESSGIRKLTYAEKANVQDVDQQELQSLPARLREYLDPSIERFRNQSKPENPGSPIPVSMPEGLEQLLDWSEPINGLRAGVAIRTALTEATPGKDLRILVIVQNVSENPIRFCPSTKHESSNQNSISLQSMGLSIGGHSFAPSDYPPKIEATIPPQKVFWFDFLAHQTEHLPDEEHRELCEQLVQQILDNPHQTLSVSLKVHDAPEGAWTGTLSTPPTRGGLGARPSEFPDASCYQLYGYYVANARREHDSPGDIPGDLITPLHEMVQQFIRDNKDDPSTILQVKHFELLAERFDNTGDWKQDAVIALLHDIADISTVPLKRAAEKAVASPAIGTVSRYASASRVEIEPTPSGNEPAMPQENNPLKGDTVVAKVNGKRITVDDVLVGTQQVIEAHTSLSEKERATVIRQAVLKRLPKHIDDELVILEFERTIPQESRDKYETSLEPGFTRILEGIKKDHLLESDEELSAKLASEGTSIRSLREQYIRMQIKETHLSSLMKVPETFTPEALKKHYEEHPEDYAIWKGVNSDNSKVTRIIQSFEDAEAKVEGDLRRKLWDDARKSVVEEIRSRSTVEILVDLE